MRAVIESHLYSQQLSSDAHSPTDETMEHWNGVLKRFMVRMAGPLSQRVYGVLWRRLFDLHRISFPARAPPERATLDAEREQVEQSKQLWALLLDTCEDANGAFFGLRRTRINDAGLISAEDTGVKMINARGPCAKSVFVKYEEMHLHERLFLVVEDTTAELPLFTDASTSIPCRPTGGHLYTTQRWAIEHARAHIAGGKVPHYVGTPEAHVVAVQNNGGRLVEWKTLSQDELVVAAEVEVRGPSDAVQIASTHCQCDAGQGKVYVGNNPFGFVLRHLMMYHKEDITENHVNTTSIA